MLSVKALCRCMVVWRQQIACSLCCLQGSNKHKHMLFCFLLTYECSMYTQMFGFSSSTCTHAFRINQKSLHWSSEQRKDVKKYQLKKKLYVLLYLFSGKVITGIVTDKNEQKVQSKGYSCYISLNTIKYHLGLFLLFGLLFEIKIKKCETCSWRNYTQILFQPVYRGCVISVLQIVSEVVIRYWKFGIVKFTSKWDFFPHLFSSLCR